MKKLIVLLITTLVALTNGCSKKTKVPEKPAEVQITENPKSNYGKAIKKTEEVVNKVKKNRAEDKSTLSE